MTASSAAVARARAERWRLFLSGVRGFARRYARRTDGVIGLAILVCLFRTQHTINVDDLGTLKG